MFRPATTSPNSEELEVPIRIIDYRLRCASNQSVEINLSEIARSGPQIGIQLAVRQSSLFDNDLIHYALLFLPRESIGEYRNPLIALDVNALQLAIRREHHVVGVGFTQENGQVALGTSSPGDLSYVANSTRAPRFAANSAHEIAGS